MISKSGYPVIAREGWPHVAVSIALAMGVHAVAGWAWALPVWLLVLFVLQFFRDPVRRIPGDADAVVSAADGKVVHVGPAEDPYLHRESIKISVFMNVFSVHSNRIPVSGRVVDRWYHHGRFLNAVLDKSSQENERNAILIRTDQGDDVVCVQVAGLIARRILCYVSPGERVETGQRYGFIRFGSRVDMYLPTTFHTGSRLGDKVHAGSDVLGTLKRDGTR